MLFKEIPGNNSVKKQLIEAVRNNRISHAQLFFGKSGSAKLALALAYAQFLNCENKTAVDSCGICSSCLKFNTLSHPDLHLVIPVLKTKKVQRPVSDHFIGQWRDFITNNYYGSLNGWIDSFGTENKTGQQGAIYKAEANNIHKKLSFKNYEAEYRVVLIWIPERMNLEASNKLLKLFEEPPRGTIFLLVTENANQLLPTIISRLQTIKIADFTAEDIVNHFGQQVVSLEKAKQLKNLTNADFGKITQILEDKEEELDLFTDFSVWMRLTYKMDIQGISKWVDNRSLKGKKQQNLFLSYTIKMIRECLIYNFASNALLKTNENEFAFLTKFSPFIHEENSVMITEKLEESIKAINRNANAKILFFELSLQMVKFLRLKRKFVLK
ncbi:MAG: DNA polymerase III subunit delta [Flavobacteriales bacterium]|jgi:DNA polymerase III subunit delta'|nr:DNA polymerase III subunit delta [Flavobacteriales bacterium]MBT5090222.1 DNA polymerase III subunit delta [Flavobacteriales bacterium]MBT5750227.1 DNA polymerase III subunit delta [Flavobacteriales bacterium]